jgi:hypothetical protein
MDITSEDNAKRKRSGTRYETKLAAMLRTWGFPNTRCYPRSGQDKTKEQHDVKFIIDDKTVNTEVAMRQKPGTLYTEIQTSHHSHWIINEDTKATFCIAMSQEDFRRLTVDKVLPKALTVTMDKNMELYHDLFTKNRTMPDMAVLTKKYNDFVFFVPPELYLWLQHRAGGSSDMVQWWNKGAQPL